MIDNALIDKSVNFAKTAIAFASPTEITDLYLVESILSPDHLVKLKKYVEKMSSTWKSDYPHRQYVSWDSDTVIEELHIVCDKLTTTIIDKCNFPDLNFLGVQIWRNNPGYTIKWKHVDNPIINVALQIYLFDTAPIEYGTTFKSKSTVVDVSYVNNSGYLLVTRQPPAIPHATQYIVEEGYTRYALYAIWSLSKKVEEN